MKKKVQTTMASKDQTMGAGILAAAVILIIVYIYWLFGPYPDWYLLGFSIRQWALVLPVLVLVLAVLGIAAWIGYTMATTPPPKPLEEIPELSETAEKKDEPAEKSAAADTKK
jgi:predicted DNA-binding transcriptional regulator